MPAIARRSELADFLRSRRERLQPADVGLPNNTRRRTPGLRREEVALLSGVSATWLTSLEQGRDVTPSAEVLDSLSRVLRLDAAERTHLYQLAHGRPPAYQAAAQEQLDPSVGQLLDLVPAPAYVTGRRWDLLGWNRAATRLFGPWSGPPGGPCNLLWWMFTANGARHTFVDWEHEARALLGRFRGASGRFADDPAFASLVDQLMPLSPELRQWWPLHDVRARTSGHKRLRHPVVGEVVLQHTVLHVAEDPDQKLVVYLEQAQRLVAEQDPADSDPTPRNR